MGSFFDKPSAPPRTSRIRPLFWRIIPLGIRQPRRRSCAVGAGALLNFAYTEFYEVRQRFIADSSPLVIMPNKEQAIFGCIEPMERTTEILPVEMANGKVVQVQVTTMGGEEDI